MTVLRFFLDEGVPKSVGGYLEKSGHTVIYLKDAIAPGSADPFVCKAALENDAILVACDSDMKQLAKRGGIGKGRFSTLSLLLIQCPTLAVQRLDSAMSLILHEWKISESKKARRLHISINKNVIRTHR
ncbi:DUF5615 family PIN-like protein [Hyphobacterium indicum]|uniref:DUF5615 family PIN-like protein n=1 Tax=Hyphobacterium indicum TaxID=2162714 RepID=UPI000D651D2E|nr:DUF5615 family PIN-like protein [Hyphobacterium indicum]